MDETTNSPVSGAMPDESGDLAYKRLSSTVVLPDGTKRLALGSGVITALLGTGGMANVYEIWNSKLEVSRAVKLLHPNYTLDSKQRFETEVKITAKLNHPNIVEIHSVGDWNNLPYIEMEKIDGLTLEKLVVDRGGLPMEVCTAIGIMVCRALCHAHSHEYTLYGKKYRGVVHRDLKPNNIMVTKTGIVKLMDFGIAKPIDASLHTTDATAVMGTIQYLSPEQFEGKNVDIRSDIYSLATVLYEMVTGVRAFPESNISRLMISKSKNDFKSLDHFALRIAPKLKRVIERCMSASMGKRVQNVSFLLESLSEIHKTLTVDTPEQVMKQFVNMHAAQKGIVPFRNQLPRQILWGVMAIAVLIASMVSIQKYHVFKSNAPQSLPVSPNPSRASLSLVTSKKVDSLESYISAMTTKNSALQRKKIMVPTAGPKAPSPQSLEEPARSPDEFLIDELKNRYATQDLLELFAAEIKSKHLSTAKRLYAMLDANQIQTKKASIFHLRLLRGLNNHDEIKKTVLATPVDDGEFYLEKARYYFEEHLLSQCLAALDAGVKTPGEFADPVVLRQEMLYYRALCFSYQFDEKPSQASLKKAMDAWFEVKFQFRMTPEHSSYLKAMAEMQRLGELSGKY